MSSKPITKSFQDVPPPGGYPKITIKNSVGQRGPPGWFIWGAVFSATCFGLYQIGRTNENKRAWRKEKRDGRMAVWPYLNVLDKRTVMIQLEEDLEHERKVMANVPGWKVGEPLSSKRYIQPVPLAEDEEPFFIEKLYGKFFQK